MVNKWLTEAQLCNEGSEVGHRNLDELLAVCPIGMTAFTAKDDELLIDLDSPSEPDHFGYVLDNLRANGYRVKGSPLYTTSKSGNTHIYIQLTQPMDNMMRIVIQAALGSDPIREVLSAIRCIQGAGSISTALFEMNKFAPIVELWRQNNAVQVPAAQIETVLDDIPY